MSTPNSGSTAYATTAQLSSRYDQRTLGDLASDTGTRVPANQLSTSQPILDALQDAAGMIEAACSVGNRYTPADLLTLTGNGAAFLTRLNCDLAIGLLFQRRPDKGDPPKQVETAWRLLDALEAGHMVFGLLEAAEAGQPTDVVETSQDVYNRNGVAVQMSKYFGRRVNTLADYPANGPGRDVPN